MTARLSRRSFIQTAAAAGIAIKVSFIGPRARATIVDSLSQPSPSWLDQNGRPRFRLDAIAKVTGQKIFSRDFRAIDMPGWPREQSHAFLIHAAKADRIFEGIDLSGLGSDLQPDRLVLAEDLKRDGFVVPDEHEPGFYGDRGLVPKGETPRLLGQPVALLIYHDFARYDAAKRKLHFDQDVVRYGAQTGPKPPPHYGAVRYVRIEGKTPDSEDIYSPVRDAVIFGRFSGDNPVWPTTIDVARAMAADATQKKTIRAVANEWFLRDPPAKGMAAAALIELEIGKADDGVLVLKRDYFSQSIDACAMEADNGNVWYEPATRTLHMLVATQSPHADAQAATEMVAKSKFKVEKIDFKAGHTVGYGTKDHAIFPLFCVLAGFYGDGRPVRLANDRFEQFQMGIKRHAFWMKKTLVIDKPTGKFKIMKGEFKCDGGGRGNYSFAVGMVGATQAQSIYYFPKSDHSAAALASRAVEAGSMRGYGSLQTMSATEMMVDEAAELLKMDPIDLRLRNVFRAGMKNTQGAIPVSTIRYEEILLKAKSHALWSGRQARKVKFDAENNGKKYGVGFAQVQKNYGGGADGSTATIEFDPQGKLTLRHMVHEIGTGATTSQAVIAGNVLGRVPDRIEFSVVEWPEMPLTSTEQPYTTPQEREDELKKNPRWTPTVNSPMYASVSVYYFGHVTREASQALLRMSLWPAAKAIWSSDASGPQTAEAVRFEDLRVSNGRLSAGSLEPLAFERVATKAHEMGMITGVSVHAFSRHLWAEAEFEVPGMGRTRLPIDALAVKYGRGASAERKALMTSGGFHFIERSSVSYPPTQLNNAGALVYSSIATLAEVAVDPSTGKVQLLSHHSIVDCGPPVVPEFVSGQIQGGLAMGIGHALHEYLPLYEDGPGNGTWNFHRYKLPLASDVAVWTQTAELLPPLSKNEPPKGIAEVTMIAVIPAIANAVAHAIGKRFYEFPITPAKIRGVRS